MKVLILCLIIFFAGCATKPDAVLPPMEKVVHIDSRALEPCLSLLRLEEGFSELETTVRNFEIYTDCANRQKTSIILLKKFSNYKEE